MLLVIWKKVIKKLRKADSGSRWKLEIKKANSKGEEVLQVRGIRGIEATGRIRPRQLLYLDQEEVDPSLHSSMTKMDPGSFLAHGAQDLTFEVRREEGRDKCSTFTVDLEEGTFHRVEGIFETDLLNDKKVVIFGQGTGGSLIANYLARSGIGSLVLVDRGDRIKPPNISRHLCGISDLGRLKTEAMKEKLSEVNPRLEVECANFDASEAYDKVEKRVKDADLVVEATGSPYVAFTVNEACWDLGIPSIYGGVFERGVGGFVQRVEPPETPCFNCVQGKIIEGSSLPSRDGPVAYSSVGDPAELDAEPGLYVDASFVGLIQVKVALLTLLKGTGSNLGDIPREFILWGNRESELFSTFFERKWVKAKKRPGCPVCQEEPVPGEKLEKDNQERGGGG